MKKSVSVAILALLVAMVSCQKQEVSISDTGYLYAQIEDQPSTRTVMDDNNNILWSEGDKIIAFMKTSLGLEYEVASSSVGKPSARFEKVDNTDDGLNAGTELNHNVAYYPYSETVDCMKSGDNYVLDVILPAEQAYAQNSFGNGSMHMVAVSEDNNITFRNVCGGIRLQLKGTMTVASIRLEGKNSELLSGAATITAYTDDSKPSITMASDASTSVTLNCGSGVQLNESTATEFIIALPPVLFSKGFTVTITDLAGNTYMMETDKENEVLRSSLLTMPGIVLSGGSDNPEVDTYLLVGEAVGGWDFDDPVVLALRGGYYVAKGVEIIGEKDMHFTKNSSWEGNVKGLHGRIAPDEIGEVGKNNISLTVGGVYDVYLSETLDKFYFMTPGKLPSEAVEHVEIPTVWGVCGVIEGNAWGASSDPILSQEGDWFVVKDITFTEIIFKVRGNNTWADNNKWGCATKGQICRINEAIPVSTCTEYVSKNPGAYDNPDICIEGAGTYDIYFSPEKKEVWVMTPGLKPVYEISLSSDSLELIEGDTAQLTAMVNPDDATGQVVWSSDNPAIATVDQSGLVTAVSAGMSFKVETAKITVEIGGKVATCSVTVRASAFPVPETPEDPMPASTDFKARVLVTEFTSTTCPYSYILKSLLNEVLSDEEYADKVVHTACHTMLDRDPFYINTKLDNYCGISSYPSVNIDLYRTLSDYNVFNKALIDDFYSAKEVAAAGIAVNSSVYGGKALINVTVKAAEDGEYRIGALLLEDNLWAQQTNATEDWMNNHDNVIRYSDLEDPDTTNGDKYLGHAMGRIEKGKTADHIFEWDPEVIGSLYNWKNFVMDNLHLVVFVSAKATDDNGNQYYYVNNVIDCPINGITPFEYN